VQELVLQVDFLMPCATKQYHPLTHLHYQICAQLVSMDLLARENLMRWHHVSKELAANHRLEKGPGEAALRLKWY
jgi:hypothetical protein